MAYEERGGGGFRSRGRFGGRGRGGGGGGFRSFQPYDVSSLNLKCAQCGTAITQLPFRPLMNEDGTPQRPIYCKPCNDERRKSFRSE